MRNTIVVILASFLLHASLVAKEHDMQGVSDDSLIISALFFTQNKMYAQAIETYQLLYDRTKAFVFLSEAAKLAPLAPKTMRSILKRLRTYAHEHPEEAGVYRALIPISLALQNIPEAIEAADALSERSKDPDDAVLAAKTYLFGRNVAKAQAVLEKAYRKTHDEAILLKLATVLEHEGQSDKAVGLLEMHRRMYDDASDALYRRLLSMYVKKEDIDGIIGVYEALYAKHRDSDTLQRLMQAFAYKGDYRPAVAFLEKFPDADPETLYGLYKSMKRFDKAVVTARKLYARTKDPKWLAEEAIMTYEGAKDKNDAAMLCTMSDLFDRAIQAGADASLYLNYYGYTLIDHDIDVQKGIALLHRALRQQPDNAFYLDSLAWGYYKLGQCRKAYDVMEKVVLQKGKSIPEIARHWDEIRRCKTSASATGLNR